MEDAEGFIVGLRSRDYNDGVANDAAHFELLAPAYPKILRKRALERSVEKDDCRDNLMDAFHVVFARIKRQRVLKYVRVEFIHGPSVPQGFEQVEPLAFSGD